jgi:hypothetical protein
MLRVVPEDVVPKDVRSRSNRLFDEMDPLLFLDTTNELAVNRSTFIRIVNTEDFIPKRLRDITLVETSKYLGRRIKKRGKGRRIPWREGAKHGLPNYPLSEEELRRLGVTQKTSTSELADLLKKQFPELPAFWMNEDSKQLADGITRQFEVNRTAWDCMVANLGFWAALTLAGGLAIFVILVGSGVPWPWALLIAGIYQTGATLYFCFSVWRIQHFNSVRPCTLQLPSGWGNQLNASETRLKADSVPQRNCNCARTFTGKRQARRSYGL